MARTHCFFRVIDVDELAFLVKDVPQLPSHAHLDTPEFPDHTVGVRELLYFRFWLPVSCSCALTNVTATVTVATSVQGSSRIFY